MRFYKILIFRKVNLLVLEKGKAEALTDQRKCPQII